MRNMYYELWKAVLVCPTRQNNEALHIHFYFLSIYLNFLMQGFHLHYLKNFTLWIFLAKGDKSNS